MRFKILFFSLIFASFCWATPFISTISDPYGPGGSCSDPSCDVIGNYLYFDIQSASLSVTGDQATVTLLFNDENNTLSPYTLTSGSNSLNLNVGDMFFYDPANSTDVYGVPLVTHKNYAPAGSNAKGTLTYTAGYLYDVATGGALTPKQALTDTNSSISGWTYRPDQYYNGKDYNYVAINNATQTDTGSVVSIIPTPGGPTSSTAGLTVTVTFKTDGAKLANGNPMFTTGPVDFEFGSADCANDIITGTFSGYYQTPEPSSFALAFGGLLLAGIGLIRRKRTV
jgi:hypothetical protein